MEGRDAGAGDDRVNEFPLDHHEARRLLPWFWRHVRKVVVGIIGGTIVLIGLALLVLPGPGILTVILGLAILATEYAFARRWLRMARERAKAIMQHAHLRRHAEAGRGEADGSQESLK